MSINPSQANRMMVTEFNTNVSEFMSNINALFDKHNIIGVGIMLMRSDGLCTTYAFGLGAEDMLNTASAFEEYSNTLSTFS